jgi:hypothetical protein
MPVLIPRPKPSIFLALQEACVRPPPFHSWLFPFLPNAEWVFLTRTVSNHSHSNVTSGSYWTSPLRYPYCCGPPLCILIPEVLKCVRTFEDRFLCIFATTRVSFTRYVCLRVSIAFNRVPRWRWTSTITCMNGRMRSASFGKVYCSQVLNGQVAYWFQTLLKGHLFR